MIYLILAVFALGIILNYFYSKANIIKNYTTNYLIWFGLPLLILLSLLKDRISIFDLTPFFLASLILLFLINFLVFYSIKGIKLNGRKKASLFLASVYPNTAFLGIPVATFFFQGTGAVLAAFFTVIVGLFHYSLGVYLSNAYLKRSRSAMSEVLKFPLFWSILIAFILSFFVTNVQIPEELFQFSKSAIYLAPFVLGLTFRMEKVEFSYAYGFIFKFALMPLLAFLVLLNFNLPQIQQNTLLLLSVMPPALTSTLLAIKYRFDERLISGFTSYSTLAFLVVVFVISLFL